MTHIEQVQRAIDFIEVHLSDELDIDLIAKEAAFSRWHFQIVFSSMVGETVKEYIRKRRLSNALKRIRDLESRILDVAIEAGFESQEAFSRAFKNQFGLTPGDCRKEQFKNVMVLQKPQITMDYLNHLYGGFNMTPVFKKMSEFKVVGLSEKFVSILSPEKNDHIVIPTLWDRYLPRRHEILHAKEGINYGVCLPVETQSKSHPDECLYMACAEVSYPDHVPNGMVLKVIPAGEYAVFTHTGKLDKLDHTMNYIYGSWLPKSGKKLREAPDLELYDHRFNPTSDNSEFDIYIPIL